LIASVLVTGVTAIEVNVAAVTVRVVEPEIMPTDALIVAVPALSVFAECVVASSVATAGELDVNVALLDTSDTLPSENDPVAVN
jgi:hypothetical protein